MFILINPENTSFEAVKKKGIFTILGQMQSDSSFIMLHFSKLPQLLQFRLSVPPQ